MITFEEIKEICKESPLWEEIENEEQNDILHRVCLEAELPGKPNQVGSEIMS